jgi:hypothetical protein
MAFPAFRGEVFCAHCKEDVVCDYYAVTDETWKASGAQQRDHLHLECLEQMLGRKLTPVDFTTAPVNREILFGYRMAAPETPLLPGTTIDIMNRIMRGLL